MAWADWLAESGPPEALARAAALEPREARLRAMNAIVRSDNGDSSGAVDDDLRQASELNPFDSTVLMTLGLRAEFRRDLVVAEAYYTRAADVDRQFKPAWTLANFYARSHQPEKVWPMLRRCLQLDPLGFDPAPVFDLAWEYSNDRDKILDLMPRRRPRLIEYLSYLIRTERVDAATEVWPLALAVANPVEDAAALTPFPGLLVKHEHVAEAVKAWNTLVDANVVSASKLNPAVGASVADPEFNLPSPEGVFSWIASNPDGVFMRKLSPGLRIELDGNEPETVTLLSLVVPVIPGRAYKMRPAIDASGLTLPDDAGFQLRIVQTAAATTPVAVCPLLTHTPCVFSAPSNVIRIDLIYSRAPGTVRAKGSLTLTKALLEFAS